MAKDKSPKQYDLEERTFLFASDVRVFIKGLKKSIANIEDGKQVVRSSGSVAANYIEANESLSKKDFIYRIKICRQEAKESRLFLHLIDTNNKVEFDKTRSKLIQEATELMKIFGSIVTKSEQYYQLN